MTTNPNLEAWKQGELGDEQAARALAMDLGEVESELAPLLEQKEQIRNGLSKIVGKLGDKHEIAGFGTLVNTAPSVLEGFDKKRLNRLIMDLLEEGNGEMAQRIAACRTKSMRSGTLQIRKEKQR